MHAPDDAKPTGKIICLFSDGTGNSSAKISKTNVWRLYQALDLGPPQEGQRQQIAFYDNGVGSSGGKILMLLGGVFGYGLKRNVLDLYSFLCRNYRPGDQIFAFGFSRGAFTVRLLMGLVTRIGVAPYQGEACVGDYSAEMYRQYRKAARADKTWTISNMFQGLYMRLKRYQMRRKRLDPHIGTTDVRIRFIGVWDTVAAYGTPISELTRAVDRWIWPLSLKDYALSGKVDDACHALALDDERDTFHPLLWDEVAEQELVSKGGRQGRLKQVWFAGMHSDVGGGYPDSSLSLVPLDWMMGHAEAAGLRFRDGERKAVQDEMNPFGPMHDSRGGLASYYRYQPRRLSARMEPPGDSTLLMQDPVRQQAHGRLLNVVVHPCVMDRIEHGTDGYAPITLPSKGFLIEGREAPGLDPAEAPEPEPRGMADGSVLVWNLVWRRRIAYFFSIVFTLLLVLMPLVDDPSDCSGPVCLVSPVVSAAGSFVPAFLRPWAQAWANNPTLFLLLGVGALYCRSRSVSLQLGIHDRMREVWKRSPGTPAPEAGKADRVIEAIRTNRKYQKVLQSIKWRGAPGVFGLLLIYGLIVALATLVLRVPPLLMWRNVSASYCEPGKERALVGLAPVMADRLFETKAPCWATGMAVQRGAQYRLSLTVKEPWNDGARDPDKPGVSGKGIPTDPEGFSNRKMKWLAPIVFPGKRVLSANWFQPVLSIRDKDGHFHTFPVKMLADSPTVQAADRTYSGTFESPTDGEAFLFVNDAVLLWYLPGKADSPLFYSNNQGTAEVSLARLPYSALLLDK